MIDNERSISRHEMDTKGARIKNNWKITIIIVICTFFYSYFAGAYIRATPVTAERAQIFFFFFVCFVSFCALNESMRHSCACLGGVPRFPYPKYVWSPAGGWWNVSLFFIYCLLTKEMLTLCFLVYIPFFLIFPCPPPPELPSQLEKENADCIWWDRCYCYGDLYGLSSQRAALSRSR